MTKQCLYNWLLSTIQASRSSSSDGTSFTLGFCQVWGKSRNGNDVVQQVTAKNWYARALAAYWCRKHRHLSIPEQHAHLVAMTLGHYTYYSITGGGSGRKRDRYRLGQNPPLSSFADRQFGTESCSQLTNVVTETVFHIARFVEAALHQLLDPCLRGGALHGSKERAPLGGDLRVRR